MPSSRTVERGEKRPVRPRTPIFKEMALPDVPALSLDCTPGMRRITSPMLMAPVLSMSCFLTTVRAPIGLHAALQPGGAEPVAADLDRLQRGLPGGRGGLLRHAWQVETEHHQRNQVEVAIRISRAGLKGA
jgi:hypothetical protein